MTTQLAKNPTATVILVSPLPLSSSSSSLLFPSPPPPPPSSSVAAVLQVFKVARGGTETENKAVDRVAFPVTELLIIDEAIIDFDFDFDCTML
jgi:hypothetical protein